MMMTQMRTTTLAPRHSFLSVEVLVPLESCEAFNILNTPVMYPYNCFSYQRFNC
jgi:hypothetical protein